MTEEEILKECTELAENEHHELGNCWDEEYSSSAIFGLIMLYKQTKKSEEVLANKLQEVNIELDKYKRLAEMNLKDSEEFKENMCEHRCILNNQIMELTEEINNLKEIEKSHKEENGKLRVELDELEKTLKQTQDSWFEDTKKLEQEQEKNKRLELENIELKQKQIINKNSIPQQDNFCDYYNYIHKGKLKEKIELLKDILKVKEKDENIYKQIPIEYLKGAIEQLEELLEEN